MESGSSECPVEEGFEMSNSYAHHSAECRFTVMRHKTISGSK